HLVDRLLGEGGWHVTVLDDFNDFYDPQIKRANIAAHVGRDDFRLIEGDIRDREMLRSLFARDRYDVIVHLAARAGVRP
ncbi:GDP-mannose 4,6-dehydratase, partial [Escherichia coli]|nr:GDP-mannose 4,6-dehydratase [Escherichia coli]